jgi:basic membrane protein A
MAIDRRIFLRRTAASVSIVVLPALCATQAWAAEPVRIGVMIPGSKSDHGWMESGYNGVMGLCPGLDPDFGLQTQRNSGDLLEPAQCQFTYENRPDLGPI